MIKPQIQDFLIGTAIFAVSFLVAFYLFGGGDKFSRTLEAYKVSQINKEFEKQLEAEKKKQEEIVEEEEQSSIENVDNSKIEGNIDNGDSVVEVVDTGLKEEGSSVVVENKNNITAEELAEKFKNVLDLGANEEWKLYPIELRKAAFDIMNPSKELIQNNDVINKPQEGGDNNVSDMSQLDQVFMGVEEKKDIKKEIQNNKDISSESIYVVEEGDSWWSLSDVFKTTPAILKELNPNISELVPGEVINLPIQ